MKKSPKGTEVNWAGSMRCLIVDIESLIIINSGQEKNRFSSQEFNNTHLKHLHNPLK